MIQRNELSPEVERLDAIGEAARAAAGQLAYALDVEQQCCGGLNFGYFYDRSPIIAYDGEQAPTYTMGTFTSTTVPGSSPATAFPALPPCILRLHASLAAGSLGMTPGWRPASR
jgi:hypothetical protein